MSRISDFFSRLLGRKVPASVFVTMNPQMQAVRIAVRENGRQSFEDYVREQVAACSRSSVVPDHTLLHLTFPDSKAIPSRRGTTNGYFYGKLAPAFIRQDIHPEPAVSLRDAAFALSKGLSPLSPAGRREQLMRDPEYRRFTMHCARTTPDDAPLYRAVTSSQGTYLFSDTPKGRRAMYCYMQYMTDRFFGMRTDADTLKIYELKHLPPRIAAMADKCIDKFVKSDLKSEYPGLERSPHDPIEESGPGVCGALCHFPDILFRVFQKRKEWRHDDACIQSLVCHGADRRKPLRRGRDARLDLFAEPVVGRGNGHHT